MRCKKHERKSCGICFPQQTRSMETTCSHQDQDDGFALGLATGITTSAMGLVGAAIHECISPSYEPTTSCDTSSSYESSSSCDTSSSYDSGSSCGGDF